MKAPERELNDYEIYLRQALEALNQIIFLKNMRIRVLEDQLKEEKIKHEKTSKN
jgi:hypothetical protein